MSAVRAAGTATNKVQMCLKTCLKVVMTTRRRLSCPTFNSNADVPKLSHNVVPESTFDPNYYFMQTFPQNLLTNTLITTVAGFVYF